jgi:hypothetical protein
VFMNSEWHKDMLRNRIKPAIRRKHRCLLSFSVLLLHNDAEPHTASHTVRLVQDFVKLDLLHHQPYSPDSISVGP